MDDFPSISPMGMDYTGIKFNPMFEPPELALDFRSKGFLVLNEIIAMLTGVFARNGQLIGLAVDAGDGRQLMLPLLEVPQSAHTMAFNEGETLGHFYSWYFGQLFKAADNDDDI